MRINPDGPIISFLSGVFDVLMTTALFVLCCLPVITAGASATAMHATMLSITEGSCSSVTRKFFGTFKDEFKISTGIWLLALLAGAVVAADGYVCWGVEHEATTAVSIMRGLTIGCGLLYICALLYVFPGIARYVVTWKQAICNTLIWTVKKPLHTIAILILNALIALAAYLLAFWAVFVAALLLYLQALVLRSVFGMKRVRETEARGGEEEIYY